MEWQSAYHARGGREVQSLATRAPLMSRVVYALPCRPATQDIPPTWVKSRMLSIHLPPNCPAQSTKQRATHLCEVQDVVHHLEGQAQVLAVRVHRLLDCRQRWEQAQSMTTSAERLYAYIASLTAAGHEGKAWRCQHTSRDWTDGQHGEQPALPHKELGWWSGQQATRKNTQ